jgi:hypothetical protein
VAVVGAALELQVERGDLDLFVREREKGVEASLSKASTVLR